MFSADGPVAPAFHFSYLSCLWLYYRIGNSLLPPVLPSLLLRVPLGSVAPCHCCWCCRCGGGCCHPGLWCGCPLGYLCGLLGWQLHHPGERTEVSRELWSQVPQRCLELLSSQGLLWMGKGPESRMPLWLKKWGRSSAAACFLVAAVALASWRPGSCVPPFLGSLGLQA